MFIKEDDLKLNEWQFSQRKFLPYEIKTKLAETRIREWYDNWNGQVSKYGELCARIQKQIDETRMRISSVKMQLHIADHE